MARSLIRLDLVFRYLNLKKAIHLSIGGVTDPSGEVFAEGDDADAFTIDANGNVSLKETAVFTGSEDTYNFTVRAEDVPGNRSDQNVTLNILDSTGPVFTSIGGSYFLNENSGPNAFVYQATATDLSGLFAQEPFTLHGEDAAAFAVDVNGNVFLKENVVFTGSDDTYNFTVRAQDIHGNRSDQNVTLNISDVSGPVFDPPGPSVSISKPEKSDTFVYQVSVTDPSGVKPLWLEGDDADAFTIDANGNVSLKETAVFTGSDDAYNFTVRAKTSPAIEATKTLRSTSLIRLDLSLLLLALYL